MTFDYTQHVDETFVRIAGRWMYLFRAVDSRGQTVDFYLSETRDREAAQAFLKRALANPDNRQICVLARDGLRSYPAAVRELQRLDHVHRRCQQRTRRYCNNRIESDHRHVKRRLRAMQGPSHGGASDSGDRGSRDDSQGPGARDYPRQPRHPSESVASTPVRPPLKNDDQVLPTTTGPL